jgi:hypothetical protein
MWIQEHQYALNIQNQWVMHAKFHLYVMLHIIVIVQSSIEHSLAKHKLREHVNSLAFVLEKCTSCSREVIIHFYVCTICLEPQDAQYE